MCLTTREKHCEIAEKPITCYKTVFTRLQDAKNGDMQIFKSEFYYFMYRIGEEYALGPEANAGFP